MYKIVPMGYDKKIHINTTTLFHFFLCVFPLFPLSPLSLSPLSLFSSPALHYITPASQRIRLQPTLIPHIVSTPHTKGPPFPFPFLSFPLCVVSVWCVL